MDYLKHHGILGQKWGKRNGPPYPLKGGQYSESEKKKIYLHKSLHPNSIDNKKHFDTVIKAGKDTLSTLSYDKNRTNNTDMFYATFKDLDKHQYNAMFNAPIKQTIFDKNGKPIGKPGEFLKFKINNKVKSDIKVASEDSATKVFKNLYSNNKDFYNFVSDKDRMRKYFVQDKYMFRGYRETRKVLEKLDAGKPITEKDVDTMYRMFNCVIPYDDGGRGGKDVKKQRDKFFKEMKKQGYGAVLDTNDAIYGGFKATAPVIVFDMEQVVPEDAKRTSFKSKRASQAITLGRKILSI